MDISQVTVDMLRSTIRAQFKRKGNQALVEFIATGARFYDKDVGKEYASTEKEVDALLEKVPELSPVKDYALTKIKECRIKAGLNA